MVLDGGVMHRNLIAALCFLETALLPSVPSESHSTEVVLAISAQHFWPCPRTAEGLFSGQGRR